MKFTPGDKIALKTTAEEGVFVRIIDAKMVMIRINNVEFPVFEAEIEHPYLNWFTKASFKTTRQDKVYIDDVPKEKQKKAALASHGMQLVFMPVYKNASFDDVIEKVKVYISNQQVQGYNFHYFFESKDGNYFTIDSEVEPYSDFYVHDISYEQLATNPYFELQFAAIISHINSTVNQYQESFSIKPKKIFAYIQAMHKDNKPFFSEFLFNEAPEMAIQTLLDIKPWTPPIPSVIPKKVQQQLSSNEKVIIPVPAEKPKLPEIFIENYFTNPHEIDLHIEKICTDYEKMSADEKINFQLEIFAKVLDTVVLRGQQSLVVIHGVGKGVLKNKIHFLLNQTKEVVNYVNEYDKRYGFGATEIFFST